MIENYDQYNITKKWAEKFQQALIDAENSTDEQQKNSLLFELQISAIKSRIASLQDELDQYNNIQKNEP